MADSMNSDRIDQFDRFLDRLTEGQQADSIGDSDESITEFARRLHSRPIAPPPNLAFARSLRQSLLKEDSSSIPTGLSRELARSKASGRFPWRPIHRWWPAAEMVAMIVVIVGLAGGYLLWNGMPLDDHVPVAPTPPITAQFASATTVQGGVTTMPVFESSPNAAATSPQEPSACTIAPRTLDNLHTLAATPLSKDQQSDQELLMLKGTTADPAMRADVKAALDMYAACANSNFLPKITAMMTDRRTRQMIAALPTQSSIPARYATPGSAAPEDHRLSLEIHDVQLLTDGRARAIVRSNDTYSDGTTLWAYILVQQQNRWLIDDIIPLASRTEVKPTPTAASPMYIIENAFPPGTTVITTANVNLRSAPARESEIVEALSTGTELVVTGPATSRNRSSDMLWWPVKVPGTGQTGYVPEGFLAIPDRGTPAAPTPSP